MYPLEIIDRIGFYLTSRQKGVCQLVCRSWRHLFIPCQYRHVHIKGRRQFNQFYHALLQSDMCIGHYIKRLTAEDVYLTAQELESLPPLCPYLVSFSFDGMNNPPLSSSSYPVSLPYCQWKHLRRLTELQNLTLTNYLLAAPMSPLSSLTHLSVRFQHNHQKEQFISNLHKATDLIELSLDSITLSLSDIESIHQCCPYLQKLTLINAKLEPIATSVDAKRAVINYPFKPAKCMKYFAYQNGDDLYDNYEWLYYISKKYYTQLTSLELWCAYSIYTPQRTVSSSVEDNDRCAALASIGVSCTQLRSLKLLNITMNRWLFDAMDHAGTQLNELSMSDMTDNTIDMLLALGQSQQQVSSLTLWGWPSLCIPDTLQETIAALSRCRPTSLTFSMQFSGIKNSPVPLDLILTLCTDLTHLTLDSMQPSVGLYDAFACAKLQHFAVKNGCFRNDLFEYLALRCPRLHTLEIESCALISMGSSVDIHMPQHDLKWVSIQHIRPPSNYHHAKVASDIRCFDVSVSSKRQQYELVDYETYSSSLSFHYEQKPVETSRPTGLVCYEGARELTNTTFVSIVCNSLNELNLDTFWVN